MADPREVQLVNGHCEHPAPMMEGLRCEVQHSAGKGEFTSEPGMLGVGVVIMPSGQPRLIVQAKHADGTSLNVVLKDAGDVAVFSDCLLEKFQEAQAIAAACAAAKAKPQ